jgi:hypothetical protein
MRWFRKIAWRVSRWVQEGREEFEAEERSSAISVVRRTSPARLNALRSSTSWDEDHDTQSSQLRADSMMFRLYACVGGHILETHVYDKHDDETKHTLYMIKEEEDFAKQVSQSIMLEMMKQ